MHDLDSYGIIHIYINHDKLFHSYLNGRCLRRIEVVSSYVALAVDRCWCSFVRLVQYAHLHRVFSYTVIVVTGGES